MEQIAALYAANDELELRQKISKQTFTKIIQAVKADPAYDTPTLELSINFITDDIVKKLTFDGVTKTGETIYQKSKKMATVVNGVKIALSREEPWLNINVTHNSFVRFKLRMSVMANNWRVDLTGVYSGEMKDIAKSLQQIKTDLFSNVTVDNFQNINTPYYELEVEYIGDQTPNVEEGLDLILGLLGQNNQSIITTIGKIIRKRDNITTIKKVGNQVFALTKNTYYENIYPPFGYYITTKLDGERTFVWIKDKTIHFINSAPTKQPIDIDGEYLFDTEAYNGKYYVFDCIIYKISYLDAPFSERVKYCKDVAKLSNLLVAKPYEIITKENIDVIFKKVYSITPNTPPLDGLILTEPSHNYIKTLNYKWKPTEHNTIDFLVRKCPQKLTGCPPYEKREGLTLYWLFVGITADLRKSLNIRQLEGYKLLFDNVGLYQPIQFAPSANPYAYIYYGEDSTLDNKIVEMRKDESDSSNDTTLDNWKVVRVRTDRQPAPDYHGNDYKIAELTYMNYIDPFTIEDLAKPQMGYFEVKSGDTLKAVRSYNRYVISTIFKNIIKPDSRVIDLAGGRGQDLHRYMELGVKDLLVVDNDPSALVELIDRKMAYAMKKKTEKTTVYTMVEDLKNAAMVGKKISRYGFIEGMVDVIVCNFAFHYLCDRIDTIRGVLELVSKLLKPEGVFMITCFDGKSIFETLEVESPWEVYQDNALKYHIEKRYKTDKLLNAGQNIGVKLPFSDSIYEEPLANLGAIRKYAEEFNLRPLPNYQCINFLEFVEGFKNNKYYKLLTPDDMKYIGFHRVLVLRKSKTGGKAKA